MFLLALNSASSLNLAELLLFSATAITSPSFNKIGRYIYFSSVNSEMPMKNKLSCFRS